MICRSVIPCPGVSANFINIFRRLLVRWAVNSITLIINTAPSFNISFRSKLSIFLKPEIFPFTIFDHDDA
ncbi:hypothetical protein AB184_11670 [Klebsiella oxytoca]|nr:hypothetical protein AB184_11670 [Klebsiella oxytoca]AKL26519.1 hypothetical protein AB181_11925 [Klebsiella oxytoca]